MAVFDETPAQEAARINAASGDPEGITAEQVERNRNLNASLSGFLGRKPDGSPLDPTAPKPGLPNGSARTTTGAPTGNSATINPSEASEVNEDPTKTPAIKTFGLEKITNGPPYENVLEQFASYNCLWTLCCLEPNQFNNPNTYRGKPGALKNIVLSTAGRYDKQRVKTANGSPEFFIDNVVLATRLAGQDAGWTNVTGFTFEVYEPYSMGLFYQSLQAAAIDAGYPQYIGEVPFLLKLEFVGFDDKGRIFSSKEQLAKYFTIKITDSEMKVDEGGSRYKVTAVPLHHAGYQDSANTFPTDLTITGSTVLEVLSSGKSSLMNALNQIQFGLEDRKLVGKPDVYEIVFPVDWQDKVGLQGGISTEALRAIIDLNAGKPISASASSADFETIDYGQGDIGYSSMGFSATSGGNYLFKDAVDTVDPKTGRIQRDNMSIDPTRRAFIFGKLTPITNIIKLIVLASEYCAKNLKPEAIDPKTGLVNWFRVDIQINLLDFDKIRNQRAKKYIYRIIPFKVSAEYLKNPTSATAGTQGRETICAKRYDYLYTGLNNNILKFDLIFNGMFHTGRLPRPPQEHSAIQNTDNQSAAETRRLAAQAQSGSAPAAAASETGTPEVKPNYKIRTGSFSGEKNVEQIIADAFQDAFQDGNRDMMQVKMDIIGDPFYLSDAGICSLYLGEYGPNEQVTSDGTMNWQGTEVFIYVTFRNPIEPNLGTTGKGGLFNFPKGQWVSPYSGLYRVLAVDNKFSGGVYTQTLDLNRVVHQSIDFKGRAEIEKQSQSLYEIKEAPPQTGPVDTTVYGYGYGDEGG